MSVRFLFELFNYTLNNSVQKPLGKGFNRWLDLDDQPVMSTVDTDFVQVPQHFGT